MIEITERGTIIFFNIILREGKTYNYTCNEYIWNALQSIELFFYKKINLIDGKPCAVKVARTVWVGGKLFINYLSTSILVDIYAEPIISQVMNVYPVSSPTLSIPRVRIKTDIIGYDGEVEKSFTIPTPHVRSQVNL